MAFEGAEGGPAVTSQSSVRRLRRDLSSLSQGAGDGLEKEAILTEDGVRRTLWAG